MASNIGYSTGSGTSGTSVFSYPQWTPPSDYESDVLGRLVLALDEVRGLDTDARKRVFDHAAKRCEIDVEWDEPETE